MEFSLTKPSSYYNCFSSKGHDNTRNGEGLHYPLGAKGQGGLICYSAAFFFFFCLYQSSGCFCLLFASWRLIASFSKGRFFHKIRRAKSVSAVLRWDGIMSLLSSFSSSSALLSFLSHVDHERTSEIKALISNHHYCYGKAVHLHQRSSLDSEHLS
jgi:hypothetical protein